CQRAAGEASGQQRAVCLTLLRERNARALDAAPPPRGTHTALGAAQTVGATPGGRQRATRFSHLLGDVPGVLAGRFRSRASDSAARCGGFWPRPRAARRARATVAVRELASVQLRGQLRLRSRCTRG